MTVDAEGRVWLGHWGGWRITRFTPDGEVERVVEMPVSRVTSCVFGGPGLDVLYATSAGINVAGETMEREPLAGGLFEIPVGIKGLPTQAFAG
jgi:sugar lactone lactonase YvrE